MYGLIGGPFPYGLYYSRGLDVLAGKLRKLGANIEVLPSFGFSQWRAIVADIKKQPVDTRIVIFGHSMGANRTAAAAAALGNRTVDLIAAFDPTIWYPSQPIGSNVNEVLWFHGTNIFSVAGHGKLRTTSQFEGSFKRININKRHERIDDCHELHEIVIDRVLTIIQQRSV